MNEKNRNMLHKGSRQRLHSFPSASFYSVPNDENVEIGKSRAIPRERGFETFSHIPPCANEIADECNKKEGTTRQKGK